MSDIKIGQYWLLDDGAVARITRHGRNHWIAKVVDKDGNQQKTVGVPIKRLKKLLSPEDARVAAIRLYAKKAVAFFGV